MDVWHRIWWITRDFFDRLFKGENPFEAFIQIYYGCPDSKSARKLHTKRNLYK
ncbi:MAG: hypothetical protein IKH13_05990 [Clostridia bacterium]|nr:hypothetical protein [Clostridia bacterium]